VVYPLADVVDASRFDEISNREMRLIVYNGAIEGTVAFATGTSSNG
jgi:hypothetical protein